MFDSIQDAWNFLIGFHHERYNVGYVTYFQWVFYDMDKNVYKLEHQAGMVKRFVINKWFLLKNYKEHCIVDDILSVINQYKQNIEDTFCYFNKNNVLIHEISGILGKYTQFIDQKVIWNIKVEKLELVVSFFMYLNNENTKNISFDIKENNKEWKRTSVDKTQLLKFLDKNKRKFIKNDTEIVDKMKQLNLLNLKRNATVDDQEELIQRFSKIKLMSKEDISNTYSRLFIKMDKEKRYQIQACKKF